MRFSYFIGDLAQISGGDLNVFVGMSDNDSNSATSQDYILFRTDIDTVTLFFAVHALSNSVPNGSVQATFSTTPTRGTIYLEIIRESATQCRITIFSDENYTFPIETEFVTITSALKNLQFVKVMTHVSTGALGNIWTTSVDNIEIWDGVDVADSFDARRFLQFLTKIEKPLGKSTGTDLQFNLDGDTNYAYRRSANGAVDVGVPNADGLAWNFNQTDPDFQEIVIFNLVDDEKISIPHSIGRGTLGASFPPNRIQDVFKWANTITEISRVNSKAIGIDELFDTDTEMVVFGSE
jgi:hypothetical protein